MSYKSLIINPGSTSTKIGVFEDETLLFEETLRHSTEEIAQFDSIVAQKDFRKDVIAKVLAENNFDIKTLDVVVIGISKDSVASHLKFAQKYDLPFILLSDPELQAIQVYGVWQEKKLYGKVSMGVVRTTYIINEQGIIEKVMPKVKPDTNAAEILAYLSGNQ